MISFLTQTYCLSFICGMAVFGIAGIVGPFFKYFTHPDWLVFRFSFLAYKKCDVFNYGCYRAVSPTAFCILERVCGFSILAPSTSFRPGAFWNYDFFLIDKLKKMLLFSYICRLDIMVPVVIGLVIMWSLYLFGVVINLNRLPERWFPGKFDIWVSGHEISSLKWAE